MDLVRDSEECTLDMDARNKSEVNGESNAYSNVISINIDSFADREPQKVELSNVVNNSSENNVPVNLDQLIIDENGYVQTVKRELRISVDHKSGDTVVSVIDDHTSSIVRQIPQNEILAVERLITAPAGIFFRAQT
ncbi:MAG: flagellar protein FlaG [Gammaproteobacteria bacterium]